MNNRTGFTLVELLIVVFIIGVLAAIAVPQYIKAVERSRASEARTTLKAMADAANRFYNNHRAYSHGGVNMAATDLDIDPPLNPGATPSEPWGGAVGTVETSGGVNHANRMFFYSVPTVSASTAIMRAQRNVSPVNNGYTLNYIVSDGRITQITCEDGGGTAPVGTCSSFGLANPLNY